MTEDEGKEKQSNTDAKALGIKFAHMSVELVAGTIVGGGIGYWLDKHFSTMPFMMLILSVLGMIGGFWNFYKALMKDNKVINNGDKI